MKINFKTFLLLAVLSILASLLILPYLHSLTGDLIYQAQEQLGLEGALFNVLLIVQSSVMYIAAAFIGLWLYRRAGYNMPILEKYIKKEEVIINWRVWLAVSVGGGLLAAALVVGGDFIFLRLGSPLSLLNNDLPVWWKGILGAYSAAVGEELLFRFFLMTVTTLLLKKIFHLRHGAAAWTAVVISALLFGLLHLPATAALVDLTPLVLLRALLLNGIGAVIFGRLYWKYGFEAAVTAHFTTDIVVHGLLQIFM